MKSVSEYSPVTKAFLAGSFSGCCSTLLFQPLDLVKTRQQSLSSSSSMVGVVRTILTTDRIVGLWKGVVPSVCRTVPGVGIYFSSMQWMRSSLPEPPSHLQSVFIGASARTIAASTLIPFTVLKTRLESDRFHYRGLTSAVSSILREEGPRGLCRGLFPTLVRDVPFSALYLASYEALKSCTSSSNHCVSALGAGLVASLLTQPADVVKTRMQLCSRECPKLRETILGLYRERGVGAFSVGLAPRMLRRTVMAAMAWTVYERMLQTLQLK